MELTIMPTKAELIIIITYNTKIIFCLEIPLDNFSIYDPIYKYTYLYPVNCINKKN